jgi:DNA-binding response OmpR family regulator
MRVLVVDDDPSIRGMLSLALTESGHEVAEAVDGPQGLSAVRDNRPDAVVLDVMMPTISGWDVLLELRSDARFARLPIVLLSARDVPDDVRHGYELGASLVMSKPVDLERLVTLVEALAAHASSS